MVSVAHASPTFPLVVIETFNVRGVDDMAVDIDGRIEPLPFQRWTTEENCVSAFTTETPGKGVVMSTIVPGSASSASGPGFSAWKTAVTLAPSGIATASTFLQ